MDQAQAKKRQWVLLIVAFGALVAGTVGGFVLVRFGRPNPDNVDKLVQIIILVAAIGFLAISIGFGWSVLRELRQNTQPDLRALRSRVAATTALLIAPIMSERALFLNTTPVAHRGIGAIIIAILWLVAALFAITAGLKLKQRESTQRQ